MDIPIKKAACLYRVSTKKQVEADDIPMQKNACKEFIGKRGDWALVKEYTEKGVSGYHKSEMQRDVLQKVKADAMNGVFDVLVVFMFDRLGRREDETSFVVEWLVEQGVEVWSVKEGQQKFENRVDKLMNYIRFWQSGGESEKTSIRVSEKHKQMVEDGLFRGGAAPYGYRLVMSGITNNKGYELKKLAIDEQESEVVKSIFSLAVTHGYGGHKISIVLNDKNIKTKRGNKWTTHSVMTILKNPLYKGYYVAGRLKSERGKRTPTTPDKWVQCEEVLEELIIIDVDTWNTAEDIRNSRNDDTGKFPKQTKSPLLFIGFAKCGCCNTSMTSTYAVKKWERKSDNQECSYLQPKYICQSRTKEIDCTGQKSYSVNKVDPVVMNEIYAYLEQLEEIDLSAKICYMQNDAIQMSEKILTSIQKDIAKLESELALLNDEILKCITGKSNFSSEQLSKFISMKEAELALKRDEEVKTEADLQSRLKEVHNFVALQNMIPNWKSEFEQAPQEVKKMLLAQIVDEVLLHKDRIDIHFKFDLYDLKNERSVSDEWN